MKQIIILLTVLAMSPGIRAQTVVKDANAEIRTASGFHGIDVANGIELMLVQGNEEAVAVSAATTELRNKIKTEVRNGILKIYFDNTNWRSWGNNRKLKAYVSAKKIDEISLSSGSIVKVDGSLNSPVLSMDASSGAIFKGEVQAGEITIDQSSGSIVEITGKAETLKVEGSSGSMFEGYGLEAVNGDADVSSGGLIKMTVNKELSAEASSGGSISYKGSAMIRNIKTSSGGGINRRS